MTSTTSLRREAIFLGRRGAGSQSVYHQWYTIVVAPKRGEKPSSGQSGSSFDSFLQEEGIRDDVEAVAIKRVLAWQLEQAMNKQHITKQAMARELHTSRSQLDRLLDPRNVSVSLDTMARAAKALGKSLAIRITAVNTRRTRRRTSKLSRAS